MTRVEETTAPAVPAAADDLYSVSDANRAAVFVAALTHGPISRVGIARLTGLSQATVTKAVKPLVEYGYLLESASPTGGRGRPAFPLSVNPSRHYAIGVKLAPDHLVGVVVDLAGQVLATRRVALGGTEPGHVVKTLASLVRSLLRRDAQFEPRVVGVGIGLGGHVDASTGVVRTSPLLGWTDVPLATAVESALGLPVRVENDVNALTVAEQWFGAGRDLPWFAVVTVGAGVGCGLVLNGQLAHGAHGAAGELGHIVVDPGGARCVCGARGCLETVATDAAIVDHIRTHGGATVSTVAAAADLARAGDKAARAAFERAGAGLGIGIAALVNLVNPARIVLSGEGVVASDLLLDSLRQELDAHVFASVAAGYELVTRPLADAVWARGAASIVLEELFENPVRFAHPGSG